MQSDRAARAIEDVVAVERMAPGLVRVVTWSDVWPVDARDAGCNCPDKQYNDAPMCKHEYAALLSDVDRYPSPGIVTDDISRRAVPDGGEKQRPAACACGDDMDDADLPCFPCFRAGFDSPNN